MRLTVEIQGIQPYKGHRGKKSRPTGHNSEGQEEVTMDVNAQYHHLTIDQRGAVMALAREGYPLSHIAERCGVSTATISRELSRQFPQTDTLAERRQKYSAKSAEARYVRMRKHCGPESKLTGELQKRIGRALQKGYSPEQAANTEVKEVSHVSIYRWLYKGFILQGNRAYLRHKGKERINRKDGQGRKYGVGRSIHDRPEEINSRSEFGHFEADSIESGRDGSGCVFNFIERRTRKIFSYIGASCASQDLYNALKNLVNKLPESTIKSLTVDRGKEFAQFNKIEQELGIPVYFADPHAPWQKGSVENHNGLIREYFPKRTNFSTVSQRNLYWKAVYRINTRPRKILGWKSAEECFWYEICNRT